MEQSAPQRAAELLHNAAEVVESRLRHDDAATGSLVAPADVAQTWLSGMLQVISLASLTSALPCHSTMAR